MTHCPISEFEANLSLPVDKGGYSLVVDTFYDHEASIGMVRVFNPKTRCEVSKGWNGPRDLDYLTREAAVRELAQKVEKEQVRQTYIASVLRGEWRKH